MALVRASPFMNKFLVCNCGRAGPTKKNKKRPCCPFSVATPALVSYMRKVVKTNNHGFLFFVAEQ